MFAYPIIFIALGIKMMEISFITSHVLTSRKRLNGGKQIMTKTIYLGRDFIKRAFIDYDHCKDINTIRHFEGFDVHVLFHVDVGICIAVLFSCRSRRG